MLYPSGGLRMQAVIDVNSTDGPGTTLTQLTQGVEQNVRVDAATIGYLYGNDAAEAVMEYAR